MADLKKRIYTDQDDANLLHRRMLLAVADAHEDIRKAELLNSLQRATLPLPHYVLYLASLHHIYAPMEQVLHDLKDHPHIQPLYFSELLRLPSLEADLTYYVGDQSNVDKWVAAAATPATTAWRDRMESLRATGQAHRLIAHMYTRYLGDLSGGQIFLKRVAAMYQLPTGDDAQGLQFYEFRQIPQVNYFKDMYAKTMNNMGDELGEQVTGEIVAECKASFAMNFDLLNDLQALVNTNPMPSPIVADLPGAAAATSSPTTTTTAAPTKAAATPQCPLRYLPVAPQVSGPLVAIGLAVFGFALGVRATAN
ncbi:heme oxygenase (decycling) 1 [Sorochytrium milnesiophthora]